LPGMKPHFWVTSRLIWIKNGDVKRLFGLTLSQEDEPEPKKKNKKIHVCNATMSKENLVAYFIPVRMVHFFAGGFGLLFHR
jgi:hypothetical protein